jgi:hypothetical protein
LERLDESLTPIAVIHKGPESPQQPCRDFQSTELHPEKSIYRLALENYFSKKTEKLKQASEHLNKPRSVPSMEGKRNDAF